MPAAADQCPKGDQHSPQLTSDWKNRKRTGKSAQATAAQTRCQRTSYWTRQSPAGTTPFQPGSALLLSAILSCAACPSRPCKRWEFLDGDCLLNWVRGVPNVLFLEQDGDLCNVFSQAGEDELPLPSRRCWTAQTRWTCRQASLQVSTPY